MLDTIVKEMIIFLLGCVPVGMFVAIVFAQATGNWSDLYILLCMAVGSIGAWLAKNEIDAMLDRMTAAEELK